MILTLNHSGLTCNGNSGLVYNTKTLACRRQRWQGQAMIDVVCGAPAVARKLTLALTLATAPLTALQLSFGTTEHLPVVARLVRARTFKHEADVASQTCAHSKCGGICRFTWSDGSSCSGDFVDNQLHGEGMYVWADGRIYQASSWGVSYPHDFSSSGIQGQWKYNRMHGQGRFSWARWHNFGSLIPHDRLPSIWVDGRAYEGQFADDQKEWH